MLRFINLFSFFSTKTLIYFKLRWEIALQAAPQIKEALGR
jgi:hypothetical protein